MGRMEPYAEATEAGHPGLREVTEREGMDEEELTAARKTREVVRVNRYAVSGELLDRHVAFPANVLMRP